MLRYYSRYLEELISISKDDFFRIEFDYEEDDYDRLNRLEKNKKDCFTNKATLKKPEFDYEEDPYEPEKS